MKNNLKLKGFTLVETILVCILTFMIIACAFTILTPMRNIYQDTYNTKDTMDINNFVGEAIEKDLRYANRIYVFNGFKPGSEEEFMQDCVDVFRQDFLFTSNPAYPEIKERIFGNKTVDDVVYVMKLDCRDDDSDGVSRGYVSRYQYDKGVLNSVDSKINLVNPILYDDRNNNRGYTVDYRLEFDARLENGVVGSEDSSNPVATDVGINAELLSIELTTFKSRLDSTSLANNRSSVVAEFENTLAQQNISFPLVNIAENGKILWESISYVKNNGDKITPGKGTLVDTPRFRYYDVNSTSLPSGVDSTSEGHEIYFVYTLVNIPE